MRHRTRRCPSHDQPSCDICATTGLAEFRHGERRRADQAFRFLGEIGLVSPADDSGREAGPAPATAGRSDSSGRRKRTATSSAPAAAGSAATAVDQPGPSTRPPDVPARDTGRRTPPDQRGERPKQPRTASPAAAPDPNLADNLSQGHPAPTTPLPELEPNPSTSATPPAAAVPAATGAVAAGPARRPTRSLKQIRQEFESINEDDMEIIDSPVLDAQGRPIDVDPRHCLICLGSVHSI